MDNSPEDPVSDESEASTGLTPKMDAVVRGWQERLLQLDRRNNRLYFRPGRTAVRVVEPTHSAITGLLNSRVRGLAFDYVEPAVLSRTGLDAQDQDDDQDLAEIEDQVRKGDIESDCEPLELQRRLRNLNRRAVSWEQEQGLSVLYLAIGFLDWVDQDDQSVRSPLLLLPVSLNRASNRDPFVLIEREEDIELNETLSIRLEQLFGVRLPELEEASVTEYLNLVKTLFVDKPNVAVSDEVYLSVFSFSKLAMWRDLQSVRQKGTDNRFVRFLAGERALVVERSPPETFAVPNDLSGGRLDDFVSSAQSRVVLPADYSQLIAIEKAKTGASLVIHGPPGTGKSQTISNMIAALVAAGKKVLFVSEKTAALDVVKGRLQQQNLGLLCLDMHSDRGKKDNVYAQLEDAFNFGASALISEVNVTELEQHRAKLNDYVRALHQPLDLHGMTAYQLYGRFAALSSTPTVSIDFGTADTITMEHLGDALATSGRLAGFERDFVEHFTTTWQALRDLDPSIQLSIDLRTSFNRLSESVHQLESSLEQESNLLGITTPTNLVESFRLVRVHEQIDDCPGVPTAWLRREEATRIDQLVKERISRETNLDTKLASVKDALDWNKSQVDWKSCAEGIELDSRLAKGLAAYLGESWHVEILIDEEFVTRQLVQLRSTLSGLLDLGDELVRLLNLRRCTTLEDYRQLAVQGKRIGGIQCVPTGSILPDELSEKISSVQTAAELSREIAAGRERLQQNYEISVLSVVDHQMVNRYRSDYGSWTRRLKSTYRRDRKSLAQHSKPNGPGDFESQLEAVDLCDRLRSMEADWQASETEIEAWIGAAYEGFHTDWDSILADLRTIQDIYSSSEVSGRSLTAILNNAADKKNVAEIGVRIGNYVTEMDDGLAQLPGVASRELANWSASGQIELLKDIDQYFGRASDSIAAAAGDITPTEMTAQEFVDLVSLLGTCRELQEDLEGELEILAGDLGLRFARDHIDWQAIIAALDWTQELLDLLPDDMDPSRLSIYVSESQPSQLPRTHFEAVGESMQRLKAELNATESIVNLADLEWSSWEEAKLHNLSSWAEVLAGDADHAQEYLGYRRIVSELEALLGEGIVTRVRQATDDAGQIVPIIHRAILAKWIDLAHMERPDLGSFTVRDHESIRNRFRELDQALGNALAKVVLSETVSRFPGRGHQPSLGPVATVRRELNKRRRRLPVRTLFQRAPLVVQSLKPCILMSPLAVSQYLTLADSDEAMTFDAVIFDEASQIFPEDAVPALLRGHQIIFAGDQKQLPPSNYWRSGSEDDEWDEDSEDRDNSLEGMESILDVAVSESELFDEAHLRVHYRSRDPRLIEFSNHSFYDANPLLTFPASGNEQGTGLFNVYLPDGRYLPGTGRYGRTNRVEAEKIVDLVFECFRSIPNNESVGVVTLNQTQMDLVQDLIDTRRAQEPDTEERFSGELKEPFFIKNLENVQGDERDHIILGIGYGPVGDSGAVPQRFGPLNRQGGERRLNVAISRARKSLTVVHSLRSSQITSESVGARLLRRYLEYVADPTTLLNQMVVDPAAEPESPFEDSVRSALQQRGYKIASQVGALGYRIDLGIYAEDGETFDLGIECDGATYHRGQAARDRDWQRQAVLEDLGWTIHRVWSTAWIRDSASELDKIEDALAAAKALNYAKVIPTPQRIDTSETLSTNPENDGGMQSANDNESPFEFVEREDPNHPTEPVSFEGYRPINDLTSASKYNELREEPYRRILPLIKKVVEFEGPVHMDLVIERIRIAYALGRVRGSTRDQMVNYIQRAGRDNEVKIRGNFLWSTDAQLQRAPRRNSDAKERSIGQIPPTELVEAIRRISETMFGAKVDDVVVETARLLGFRRTGQIVRGRLNEAYSDFKADTDDMGWG